MDVLQPKFKQELKQVGPSKSAMFYFWTSHWLSMHHFLIVSFSHHFHFQFLRNKSSEGFRPQSSVTDGGRASHHQGAAEPPRLPGWGAAASSIFIGSGSGGVSWPPHVTAVRVQAAPVSPWPWTPSRSLLFDRDGSLAAAGSREMASWARPTLSKGPNYVFDELVIRRREEPSEGLANCFSVFGKFLSPFFGVFISLRLVLKVWTVWGVWSIRIRRIWLETLLSLRL